jgi:hypothetical protein
MARDLGRWSASALEGCFSERSSRALSSFEGGKCFIELESGFLVRDDMAPSPKCSHAIVRGEIVHIDKTNGARRQCQQKNMPLYDAAQDRSWRYRHRSNVYEVNQNVIEKMYAAVSFCRRLSSEAGAAVFGLWSRQWRTYCSSSCMRPLH